MRDYGIEGQLGLEPTPAAYVEKMVAVFAEVHRVLHPSGTFWLNIGDTYSSGGRGGHSDSKNTTLEGSNKSQEAFEAVRKKRAGKHEPAVEAGAIGRSWVSTPGFRPKNLLGIPWRLAFALQDFGWNLRSEVIWHATNKMPESTKDRPSKCHEQMFLFSKSKTYFYDYVAVLQQAKTGSRGSSFTGTRDATTKRRLGKGERSDAETRSLRTVWSVSVGRFKGAHFAVMPQKIVEPCVLAGTSAHGCCPHCLVPWKRLSQKVRVPTRPARDTKVAGTSQQTHGNRDPQRHITRVETLGWKQGCMCAAEVPIPCVVMDPFGGAGTVPLVAVEHGRRAIACDLNPDYTAMATGRVSRAKPNLF